MSEDAPIEEIKAIAHPLRFRILGVLRSGELNVGELEQVSGIGQPALSQQLGVLRKVGLVETRRQAKRVFYSVNLDRLSALAGAIGGPGWTARSKLPSPRNASPGAANFARLT